MEKEIPKGIVGEIYYVNLIRNPSTKYVISKNSIKPTHCKVIFKNTSQSPLGNVYINFNIISISTNEILRTESVLVCFSPDKILNFLCQGFNYYLTKEEAIEYWNTEINRIIKAEQSIITELKNNLIL